MSVLYYASLLHLKYIYQIWHANQPRAGKFKGSTLPLCIGAGHKSSLRRAASLLVFVNFAPNCGRKQIPVLRLLHKLDLIRVSTSV